MADLTYLEAQRAAALAAQQLAAASMPGGFHAVPARFKLVRRGSDWIATALVEVYLGAVYVGPLRAPEEPSS